MATFSNCLMISELAIAPEYFSGIGTRKIQTVPPLTNSDKSYFELIYLFFKEETI